MRLSERILEDYLRHTFGTKDPRILKALRKILSGRERGNVEAHLSLVTQGKLVVVCKRPERIREVILIWKENPGEVRRGRLALKGKQDASKA
jgi:hypothetical protein